MDKYTTMEPNGVAWMVEFFEIHVGVLGLIT